LKNSLLPGARPKAARPRGAPAGFARRRQSSSRSDDLLTMLAGWKNERSEFFNSR
jgi:hypothetical protein